MKEDRFTPPTGAFTRTVPIRFSHCDPAGIVYFPHYFDMFNGLVEDWYTEQLGVNYANLILGDQHGFPYVHIETDFKLPSRMGERQSINFQEYQRPSLDFVIAIAAASGKPAHVERAWELAIAAREQVTALTAQRLAAARASSDATLAPLWTQWSAASGARSIAANCEVTRRVRAS